MPDPKYMSQDNMAKRYGLRNSTIATMEKRSRLAEQGLSALGTPLAHRGRGPSPATDRPFPQPDMMIGSTKGWTPGTMDQYMASRGISVVSETQFGPKQDSFGVVPKLTSAPRRDAFGIVPTLPQS